MPSLLVIANAAAGSAEGVAVDTALNTLREAHEVELRATSGMSELSAALRDRGDRDVVVVGGDGSLHAVANVLHRGKDLSSPTVGLIPLGTGNDFAAALGIPRDPVEAADVITSGHRCKVDVLIDDQDAVVVNAVHAGIGADAGAAAKPWKWLGRMGYAVGAVVAGLSAEGIRIRVVADGKVLADGRRRLLQVAIANGPFVGGGLALLPDADPTDGRCDVMVSFAVAPMNRLRYAIRLRRGDHEEHSDVTITTAAAVSLSGRKAFVCNADGELLGPLAARGWTVCRSALTMFVPRPEILDQDDYPPSERNSILD